MPSTFTTNKVLELQATGENSNTWGSKLNTVITQIDSCLGFGAVSVAGGLDVTLTTAQARPAVIQLTGLITANINVIVPTLGAFYEVENKTTGAFTVTVKTASGTGVLVPQGARTALHCDTINIVPALSDVPADFGLSGALTPAQITGDTNDYNPTGWPAATVLRLDTDAAHNLTGLAGGRAGRIAVLHYVGAHSLVLNNQNSGSAAGNRFALGQDVTLSANVSLTLRYDDTSAAWRPIGMLPVPVRGLINVQVFGVGTATYTPTPGTQRIEVECVGGGGGGGGSFATGANGCCGSAGGGGGYARAIVTSPVPASVTVGAGGAGGGPAGTGGTGATTSFDSVCQATGGSGGVFGGGPAAETFAPGGYGGVGAIGYLLIAGQPGGHSMSTGGGVNGFPGNGGSSHLGGGGHGNFNANGDDAGAFGGGGGGVITGQSASASNGGHGGGGVCIVREYGS
jgi:hypothetical protein